MSQSPLIVEEHPSEFGGRVLTLRFNRPEARNAVSVALLEELEKAVATFGSDASVRGLVFTGTGIAFSAGADLKERAGMSDADVRDFLKRINKLFRSIEDLPYPTIAAINGFALGGGLELALCCDFRFMQENATVGLPETSLGIIPGAGGTQRLTRLIGLAAAKELIYTAARIDGKHALQIGLVERSLHPGDPVDGAARSFLLREICHNAPIAVRQAKLAINRGYDAKDIDAALKVEHEAYAVTIPTKDRLEALAAFKEKRKPVFTGE